MGNLQTVFFQLLSIVNYFGLPSLSTAAFKNKFDKVSLTQNLAGNIASGTVFLNSDSNARQEYRKH